jgi:hypothetical protein
MDALANAAQQLKKERKVLMGHVAQIDKVLSVLDGRMGKSTRRKLSRAARAKIAKAQKERWAKVRAAKKSG